MKKLLSIVLIAAMILSCFAACGGKTTTETPAQEGTTTTETPATSTSTETPAATTEATDVEKVYYGYYTADHTSLNFLDNVDSACGTLCQYCMSYLYRAYPDENGATYHFICDLAAELPVQMDEEGLVWQIPLRQDATWENGDPITADTWLFTWEQGINPNYAYRMGDTIVKGAIKIKNGSAYYHAEDTSLTFEDVGIKKIDDYTIELTLEEPATQNSVCEQYFNRNCTPVHPELWNEYMGADGTTSYGADLDHFISCGPYTLTKWDYDDMQVYTKREDHWLSDVFNYDRVEYRIVPTMNARIELWEQGLIDELTLDSNTVGQYIDDPLFVTYDTVDIYHIDVNCKNPNNPISGSINYRKALYHAIDRETLGKSVWHLDPAGWYISRQAGLLSDSHSIYRDTEWGDKTEALVASWSAEGHTTGYNPEKAVEYFEAALAECGATATKENPISIIAAFDESSTEETAMFEYLQQQFLEIFDGRLVITFYTYGGISATAMKKQGDDVWDLSPNDWGKGRSRYNPYLCYEYFLSNYSGSPNNFFDEAFEAQYEYIDNNVVNWTQEQEYEETQKLEELYLDAMITIPTVQESKWLLHSENLVLPSTSYIPGFGYGNCYGDKIVE